MSFSLRPSKIHSRGETLRRKRRLDAALENGRPHFSLRQLKAYCFPAALFCFMTAAVVLICFGNRSAAGLYLPLNKVAAIHISAREDFSYTSALQTRRQKQQREMLVPTVIGVDTSSLEAFRERLNKALDAMDEGFAALKSQTDPAKADQLLQSLSASLQRNAGLNVPTAALLTLERNTNIYERRRLFNNGFALLERIMRDGVYSPKKFGLSEEEKEKLLFTARIGDGDRQLDVRTLNEALAALEKDAPYTSKPDVNTAVLDILKQGLASNVVPDMQTTKQRKAEASAKVPDVVVHVAKGQPIIEEGKIVTEDDIERLSAYQKFLRSQNENEGVFNALFVQYLMLTVILMLCAALYLQVGMPAGAVSRSKVLLMSLVLLITLALCRGFVALDQTSFFLSHPVLQGSLSVLAPSVFGALLISVLVGRRAAVLVCLLSSMFCALMIGNSLEVFVGSLLASLITIRLTYGIHQRGRIVRASFFAGLTLAVIALVYGLYYHESFQVLTIKIIFSIAVCAAAGVLALGLLPALEFLFRITTDIRLLELTDFNHPLLRRLQIDAPGTYHHSLMVANLAERAAADIKANPIVCRVGALFHDIGKIDRPEYFSENQRSGVNPHNGEMTPPMSALIIKSHVKEGMEIAKQARLPQIICDTIAQHHGTGLIRYFFDKAVRQHKEDEGEKLMPLDLVDEATYRYDGPRPQTKETAIVHLADSVEAASRSLKKVTPQSVEELIDRIVREKLLDGQLDDSPLTVNEISKIKASFALTLLTMLHGRVAYAPAPSAHAAPKHA